MGTLQHHPAVTSFSTDRRHLLFLAVVGNTRRSLQGQGESATGEQQGCQARKKERSLPKDLQVRAENKTRSCKMLSRNTEGAMASGDSAAEVESATRMVDIDDGTETKLLDPEI